MTLCNMSIEAGSRVGMVAPDETTFAYLKGRPLAPDAAQWDAAVAHWRSLRSDDDAIFDREVAFDVSALAPRVSWGTTPEENLPITATVPDPTDEAEAHQLHPVGGLAHPMEQADVRPQLHGRCLFAHRIRVAAHRAGRYR